MRVLIACSDASVRDAFVEVLRRAGIGVVAVADAAATLELARQQRPDVVLLDDELPGIGGVAGLPRLAAEIPDSELVVLAARFDRGSGVRAVLAGAAGYLSRGIAPEALPRIVRGVMRGEAAIPRTLAMALIERHRMLARSGVGMRPTKSPLSSRKWEVLDMMATLPEGDRHRANGPARDRPRPRAAHFGQARNPLAGSGDRNRPGAPPPAPAVSRRASATPGRPGWQLRNVLGRRGRRTLVRHAYVLVMARRRSVSIEGRGGRPGGRDDRRRAPGPQFAPSSGPGEYAFLLLGAGAPVGRDGRDVDRQVGGPASRYPFALGAPGYPILEG
jgi:DNA-binding NarL/FixJ family response regulator